MNEMQFLRYASRPVPMAPDRAIDLATLPSTAPRRRLGVGSWWAYDFDVWRVAHAYVESAWGAAVALSQLRGFVVRSRLAR